MILNHLRLAHNLIMLYICSALENTPEDKGKAPALSSQTKPGQSY